jgi:hypothetical protein
MDMPLLLLNLKDIFSKNSYDLDSNQNSIHKIGL